MSISEVSGYDPQLLAAEARARAEADIARADSLEVGRRVLGLISEKLGKSRGGYVVIYEDELRDVTGAEHPGVMGEQFKIAGAEVETARNHRLGVAKAAMDTAEFLVGQVATVVETDTEPEIAATAEGELPIGYIHRF